MRLRLKKRGMLGVKKINLKGRIVKIGKNPDFGKEGLVVFFRGLEGVGIVDFGKKEMEMLREKLGERVIKKEAAKKIGRKKKK
jgi:hypothetical protein